MKRVMAFFLVVAMMLWGALLVAQTSGERQGAGTRADTTRSGTTGSSGMSRGDMMSSMQVTDQRIEELYSNWQQIYTRYHSLLEITDQQQLKREMEEVHQLVNAFNRDASDMYQNYQSHREMFMRDDGSSSMDDRSMGGDRGVRTRDTTMMRRDTTMLDTMGDTMLDTSGYRRDTL